MAPCALEVQTFLDLFMLRASTLHGETHELLNRDRLTHDTHTCALPLEVGVVVEALPALHEHLELVEAQLLRAVRVDLGEDALQRRAVG